MRRRLLDVQRVIFEDGRVMKIRRNLWAALPVVLMGLTLLILGQNVEALPKNSAAGDDCTIDLPNGLKEPGKENKDGLCCSIWDEKKCVEKPSAKANAKRLRKTPKSATVATASATPTPRRPIPRQTQVTETKTITTPTPSPSRQKKTQKKP
jgi:hypothetical protein